MMRDNPNAYICIHCGTWMQHSEMAKIYDLSLKMGMCKGCESLERGRNSMQHSN